MVLVTVLMVLMVMSIFMISILNQSLNQSSSSKRQADQIADDQCLKGLFWQFYSSGDITTRSLGDCHEKSYTATVTGSQVSISTP